MKATNNINADLKEEIDRLMNKNSKLEIQVDDAKENIQDAINKVKKEVAD